MSASAVAVGICSRCNGEVRIGDWPICPHGSVLRRVVAVHPKERAVVWEHPETGEIRYPGRNDTPMPERYASQGFVRKELETLRTVESFEKQHGVRNEKIWYDRNGRGFDG